MARQTPLWIAAQKGHTETVQELLSKRHIQIDGANIIGETPLLAAAHNNHRDVVRILLSHGANPNATAVDGTSPLFAAVSHGHSQIVRLLLTRSDLQIDYRNRYKSGGTALWTAAKGARYIHVQ